MEKEEDVIAVDVDVENCFAHIKHVVAVYGK